MARLNTRPEPEHFTHEGAPAKTITAENQLRRSVLACMLWEHEFYEDGVTITERIKDLAGRVSPGHVSQIAIEARNTMNLRHAPLLLASCLAYWNRGAGWASHTIAEVIQRADELAEFLAIHARVNGVNPSEVRPYIGAQVKKGVAAAFRKFDEYQLAKYDRPGAITLRDAMFLTHPKPADSEQKALWQRLIDGNLRTPDTWETNLSQGEDKRETFERLLHEGKLGYMALLRNLRNMIEAGVDRDLIKHAILERRGAGRVLPFRFVAAARQVPQLEPAIDEALVNKLANQRSLEGKTIVLVDVSGSMDGPLSRKSDLRRRDAAAALASLIVAEDLRVFTFSTRTVEVAPRRGMSGVDAVEQSQAHGMTDLGGAVREINQMAHERLIVITDEQSHTRVPDPAARHAYMINVASAANGVGYGRWTHIDGFSEAVIRYIHERENERL